MVIQENSKEHVDGETFDYNENVLDQIESIDL